MECAGFMLLILGAGVIIVFTFGIDVRAIDYFTFLLGAVMLLAGLVMLYRFEVKRIKMTK